MDDDEDGFRTTPAPRQPLRSQALQSAVLQHLPLLATAVAAFFFAFRCVIITQGDIYIYIYMASQLLAYTSFGDATRGFLFSMLPFGLYCVSFIAAYMAVSRHRSLQPRWTGLMAASAAAYFLGMYMGGFWPLSWLDLLSYLVVIVPLFGLAAQLRKARQGSPPRKLFLYLLYLLLPAVFLVAIWAGPAIAADEFWLPPERLVFVDESPFTGYVLSDSEDQFVILSERPRIITIRSKDDLRERALCYPREHRVRSSEIGAGSPVCPQR